MTRLSTTNIEAEGIGDVFEDLDGQGRNSSVAIGTVDTYQDRSPLLNGSTRTGRQPQGAIQYNDFRSSFWTQGGVTTYTTGTGKSAVSHTVSGWGTVGGVQAATNGGSTTAIGTLGDGTNLYTTNPKPFDQLNSSFDGNKWISAIVVDQSFQFFTNFTIFYIVMEGTGAQTTDTDWTTMNFKQDGQTNAGGVLDYTSTGGGASFARTDASVAVQQNRVVYTFVNGLVSPTQRYFVNNGQTLGYKNWIQFV